MFKACTLALLVLAACSGQLAATSSGTDGGPSTGLCPPCVIDSDCAGGGVCAQFGGSSFCATTCASSPSDCQSGTTCTQATSSAGDPVSICEPDNGACGPSSTDAGSKCPGWADPSTPASCTCKNMKCQPNGCYGGWWCDTTANKCQSTPTNCNLPDGGTYDGGGAITSNIGNNGGTESRLLFSIVGDTRPAQNDDTMAYPSATIGKIYSDIAALSPMPPFSISTGDYQFSSPTGSEAAKQLAFYTSARGKYPGVEFPAMGNHECTGATASNCGPTGADGITNNYTAFIAALLAPIGKTVPYYVINVNATDGSWTAKFVFIAANAWDVPQYTWLDATLSTTTTYTFVIRHEASSVSGVMGVTESEAIVRKHPFTLEIVGHDHTYRKESTNEVVFGNGGAPLTGGANFGFGMVSQRSDQSIQIDEIDMSTGLADTSFRFALHPDGTPAP